MVAKIPPWYMYLHTYLAKSFFLLYIVLHVLSDDVSAEVASLRVSDESVHLVTKISSNKNSKHPLLL